MLAMHSKFNKTSPRDEQGCVSSRDSQTRKWVGLLCPQHQRRGTPCPQVGHSVTAGPCGPQAAPSGR